jgi:hypothetical protein
VAESYPNAGTDTISKAPAEKFLRARRPGTWTLGLLAWGRVRGTTRRRADVTRDVNMYSKLCVILLNRETVLWGTQAVGARPIEDGFRMNVSIQAIQG